MASSKVGLTKAEYKGFYISDGTDFHLLGSGVTALDENPNAQTESTAFINDKATTSDIVGYDWKYPFTAQMLLKTGATDEAIKILHDVPNLEKIGNEATADLVIVSLYEPIAEKEGSFKARKQSVSIQIDSLAGAPVTKSTMTGTLNGRGSSVFGQFDITAKTFTADGETTTL